MKLTKLQRHTAYIILLSELEERSMYAGFCELCSLLDRHPYLLNEDDLEINPHLPDLYKHKPKVHGIYWFPCNDEGYKKRKEILLQCIKETY